MPEPDKPIGDGEATLHRMNIYFRPRQLKKLSDLVAETSDSISHHVRKAVDAYQPEAAKPLKR